MVELLSENVCLVKITRETTQSSTIICIIVEILKKLLIWFVQRLLKNLKWLQIEFYNLSLMKPQYGVFYT